jgi:DNA-binding transcriptional ArsR family regulator
MTMKNVVIAPVGDYMEALYVGIKEFPTERIILITPESRHDDALKAKKELEKFQIPVQIKDIKGNLWEETFKAVADIKAMEKDQNVLINVATGDRDTRCAATSAAFVNGLRAFGVGDNNEAMMLPVLRFSYYKVITDKKMQILKTIYNEEHCCTSLEQLGQQTGMSLPLISYHINGTLKSEGLRQLGLVETEEDKGRVRVKLTTQGKLLIRGYISQEV